MAKITVYTNRVIIDHDEVMVKGGRLHLINKYLGTNYVESDFKDYYMQKVIPEAYRIDFLKWFVTQNQYDYCTIEPYAREVIGELVKYYPVTVATSWLFPEIPRESVGVILQKHDSILDNFTCLKPENLVFIVDKSALTGKIKIDDLPSNLEGAKRKLLYTAFHNENKSKEELKLQDIDRVNNWIEIADKLLEKNWKKSLTV